MTVVCTLHISGAGNGQQAFQLKNAKHQWTKSRNVQFHFFAARLLEVFPHALTHINYEREHFSYHFSCVLPLCLVVWQP